MIIEKVKKLIDSNISTTKIEKATGVDASSIRRIRRKERKVENLSFEKGVKLYEYANIPYIAEVQFEYNCAGHNVLSIFNVNVVNGNDERIDLQNLVNTPITEEEDEDCNVIKDRFEVIKELLAEQGYLNVVDVIEVS